MLGVGVWRRWKRARDKSPSRKGKIAVRELLERFRAAGLQVLLEAQPETAKVGIAEEERLYGKAKC